MGFLNRSWSDRYEHVGMRTRTKIQDGTFES